MSLVEARGLAIAGRLQSVDIELEAGSLTALIGPNGSGKTSLLHALAQIGSATGEVRIAGENLRETGAARRSKLLSFLPASRHLPWPIRASDLIALSGADGEAIAVLMGRLELEDVARRRADILSTGERSRVLIARALAPSPRLLLLDEPTSNLDPLWQIRLMELLRAELSGSTRAGLIAVHDLDAAGAYADRLIVMDGGRIAGDDTPQELLASPVIAKVFGVERAGGVWRAVRPPADPRSSR